MFEQGPVVEQCITERATLYKYIWNKKNNKKSSGSHYRQPFDFHISALCLNVSPLHSALY